MKKLNIMSMPGLGLVIVLLIFNLIFHFLPDWGVTLVDIFAVLCMTVNTFVAVRRNKNRVL